MHLISIAHAFGIGPLSGTELFALEFMFVAPILLPVLLILGLVWLAVRKKRSSQEQKTQKVHKFSLARVAIGITIGLIVLYWVVLILTEFYSF